MQSVLLDTGPWVALIDGNDPAHKACRQALETLPSPLLSTEAVLTETLHLLGRIDAQDAAISFVLRGAVVLVPTDVQALMAVRTMMMKYADVPMDYADATLVHLGREVRSQLVFTLDRRGFNAYRYEGRKGFSLLP